MRELCGVNNNEPILLKTGGHLTFIIKKIAVEAP